MNSIMSASAMSTALSTDISVDTPNKAGIIFRNGDKYLLVLAKYFNETTGKWETGKWGFPKGSIKVGESYEDGAIREVLEETGIIVSKDALTRSQSIDYEDFGHRIILFCIDINHSSKHVTIPTPYVDNTEVEKVEWFTRNQMNRIWPNVNRSVKAKWFKSRF